MSKNEALWKAKCLMQQSLSSGTPNPKLSKMLEVLIDHFSKWIPILFHEIVFPFYCDPILAFLEVSF